MTDSDKQTIKRPNWDYHRKKRRASLHDAVALSMNISPRQIDSVISHDDKKKRLFATRIKDAAQEMNASGYIEVIERGRQDDKSDWTINLRSFVEFARLRNWGAKNEKFRSLGQTEHVKGSKREDEKLEKSTRKAPDKFVAALIRLFVEIATKAAKQNIPFDVSALPGTKEDLLELARKFDIVLDKESRTFDDYLSGLCKFSPGRPTAKTTFYSDLFPDYFKSPEKLAK